MFRLKFEVQGIFKGIRFQEQVCCHQKNFIDSSEFSTTSVCFWTLTGQACWTVDSPQFRCESFSYFFAARCFPANVAPEEETVAGRRWTVKINRLIKDIWKDELESMWEVDSKWRSKVPSRANPSERSPFERILRMCRRETEASASLVQGGKLEDKTLAFRKASQLWQRLKSSSVQIFCF